MCVGLCYIGQTGRTLKERMGALAPIYNSTQMPYRDPHTAGPGLWALRELGAVFEVSVAEVPGDAPTRKGLECLVTSMHRQEHGRSPTLNFGRMPVGFKMSSANNRKLVEAGRRFRGGPSEERDSSHEPGVAPVGKLDGHLFGDIWCGHRWSPWTDIQSAINASGRGDSLYRIRGRGDDKLVYVGEGRVGKRLGDHIKKGRDPASPQGRFFAASGLQASWVMGSWMTHQRLELECDLIAAHVLATGAPPAAQFLGGR